MKIHMPSVTDQDADFSSGNFKLPNYLLNCSSSFKLNHPGFESSHAESGKKFNGYLQITTPSRNLAMISSLSFFRSDLLNSIKRLRTS